MQHNTIRDQIWLLVGIGVPELLHLSPQQYMETLSYDAEPTCPEYRNRFDLPVMVDTRLPFSDLLSKAGIINYLDLDAISHISNSHLGPYVYCTHDSRKYSSHTAATAIAAFTPDEEGCTLQELAFFYLFYPQLFEGLAIDAIQTHFRDSYHPCIVKVTAKAEIGAHWHDDLTSGIHILSKGKRLFSFNIA